MRAEQHILGNIMLTAHLNFMQPSKQIFTKSIWMGAVLLLSASSYTQNWIQATTVESKAYCSYYEFNMGGHLNPSAIMFFI